MADLVELVGVVVAASGELLFIGIEIPSAAGLKTKRERLFAFAAWS